MASDIAGKDIFANGENNPPRLDSTLFRRIDLTTLRLFVAVCEEKNLTRAATREGIAASAVSKRLHDFELSFGVPPSDAKILSSRRVARMPSASVHF